MPSSYTSVESKEDVAELASRLGIELNVIPINPMVGAYQQALAYAKDDMERAAAVVMQRYQERLTAYQALQALTTGPAYQVFEEGRKGRIKAGLLADFVVLLASHHSRKEADHDHPYGHQRYETAASLALGLMLLAVGVGMVWTAVHKLQAPESIPAVRGVALVVAAGATFNGNCEMAPRDDAKIVRLEKRKDGEPQAAEGA